MPEHSFVSLDWTHPLVREWFLSKFSAPTEPQVQGWPPILAGKTTLISAPTGSGKTLAAFMVCIDRLVRLALAGTLLNQTQVVYVSPLKALTNDVQKNLLGPLQEIQQLAKKLGLTMQDIDVLVRTGDTPTYERQKMLKKQPHILVTTPESLYLLLTGEKSRAILENIETVIVDEIHALANNKRGSHLVLSLERLQDLCQRPFVRIGLSATQKPIELIGKFLGGSNRPMPVIINIGHQRQLELHIEVPEQELTAIASNTMWDEVYDKLAQLAKENRSILIFVNTRKLAERVAHHLAERLDKEQVAAHHGSLSRKIRLNVETRLKNGELKALVATASLELGIDIGTVDLVCLLGSPRAISIALQRIGRAGHWHAAISKGRVFPTTTGELLECAALIHAIQQGDLDKLLIPHEPLDILAQQLVAACSSKDWKPDELFSLIRDSLPYAQLSREQFDAVLHMLSEGVAGSRGRYGAYLYHDKINNLVKARRGSRLTAITSGGAIPETGLFTVISEPNQVMIGTLDEDFAVESNRGDVILLGSTSWIVKRVESAKGRVIVEDAHGAPPSVPFWRGEAPARSDELSLHVSQLRIQINQLLENGREKAMAWLKENCRVDEVGAGQLINYIEQGKAVLGDVPSQETIIAERFFDESGGMQLVLHTPFGARINKAWGLALRKRFCRSFNFELQAAATDDGINISLAEQHSFPLLDVFQFVHSNTIEEVLIQAVLQSPLFTTRWRWDAMRSLALVRFRNGKKVPPNILRMRADDLLAAVFPDAAACQDNLAGEDIRLPDHPLIYETMKDVLTEALDLEGLKSVLKKIEQGQIQCLAIDTPVPSIFSHEILNANPYAFLDDAPLEERRARVVELRRMLPESLQDIGKLDADVIAEVQQQSWADVRNADELHDLLQTVSVIPIDSSLAKLNASQAEWSSFWEELVTTKRAGLGVANARQYWIATEKTQAFQTIYPQGKLITDFVNLKQEETSKEEAINALIRGWLHYLGPTQSVEIADLLGLPVIEVEQSLFYLESTGSILRGSFTPDASGLEWCERRLLARIHQLTLQKLRKQIQPVSPAQFMHWLLQWQHVLPSSNLQGEHGVLEVIKQLQGYEIPANAWEKDILMKRVKNYQKDFLDKLCFMGAIGWGRVSKHPALEVIEHEEKSIKKRRIQPTSVVPITFFVREEASWIQPWIHKEAHLTILSGVAKAVYTYLKEEGASFMVDIVNEIGHLRSEVESALWELVAAGLITADGFDNLRSLIDAKRRLRRRGHLGMSAGRWSILKIKTEKDPRLQIEATCWLLLKRYGVCFRELLSREKIIPSWRGLLSGFHRLEERGEIRGGRFVSGFGGEQFALPYAVESLRSAKLGPESSQIILSAVDPLNLVGIIVPGARTPAISRKKVPLPPLTH